MTIFTNSKLTDEYVSNATLIRLILWADQHNSHYVAAALRELQERRKADSVPVEINDDMAYAFHHALSDSSPGADEVEEIKTGLRAAFSNVTAQPAPVVPDEIEPDDGNTFDYVDGWNACRAAMLHGAEPVSQTYKLNELAGNYPVTPDGWVMVPKEPTQAMIKAWLSEIANFRGHAAGYRAALEAAPQL
ncbi:hypothetical protein A13S_01244 [Escherichia coli KTE191]|nr:hypothetical protein [Escherichia coli]ELC91953.1 hypothetical protein A13S_01244 [Escherichia coli KTE191]ELI15409.1 hypothetical protein WI9_00745 [Escherichia coli KTE106]